MPPKKERKGGKVPESLFEPPDNGRIIYNHFAREITEQLNQFADIFTIATLNSSLQSIDTFSQLISTPQQREVVEEALRERPIEILQQRMHTFENILYYFERLIQFHQLIEGLAEELNTPDLPLQRGDQIRLMNYMERLMRQLTGITDFESLNEYVEAATSRMQDLQEIIHFFQMLLEPVPVVQGQGRRRKRGGVFLPSLNPIQGYYDAARFAYNYATGTRTYSKKVQDFFKKHGDERIVGLEIEREPLQAALPSLLSWFSGGKFKENVKNADYDKLFHLSINITTENGTFFKIEKNEDIAISNSKRNQAGAEFIQLPVPNGARVFGFIDAGRKAAGDDNFFIYSAKDRNCQRFVLDILRANHCLTPQAQAFVFQDTSKIFEDLDYLRRLSNTATDLGYLAKGLLGMGRKKGGGRRKGTKDIGVL